jgi:GGDEF domain-containing protein
MSDINIKKCITDLLSKESRHIFEGILQYQINLYNRYYSDDKFSVLVVHVDNIKRHDDTVKTILKKEVADFILRNTRNSDACAMLTDDKFVILLTHTDANGAKLFGQKIQDFCEGKRFCLKIVGREYAGLAKEEFLVKVNSLLSNPQDIDENDVIISC